MTDERDDPTVDPEDTAPESPKNDPVPAEDLDPEAETQAGVEAN